jgi:hypothetical protein
VVTSSEKPLPVVLALRDCSSLVSSGSVSPVTRLTGESRVSLVG